MRKKKSLFAIGQIPLKAGLSSLALSGLRFHKSKFIVLSVVALFSMSFGLLVHESQPDANHTGSPGDGKNCTNCHADYNVNSGPATASITSNIPVCGYIPGNTYTVTASIFRTGGTKFQFELSPQNSSGTYLGTLIPGPNSRIHTSEPKDIVGTFASMASSNGQTWTFTWTAPVAATGPVTFYAVFNDADDDGSFDGDYIYTRSLTVTESGPFIATIAPTNASCNSLCNGSAAANVCSGTAPYTYTWNTGATSSAITGLCAGAYTVVVADASAATAISTIDITQPAAVTASVTAINVLCNGNSTGSVTAMAGGGTPGFTYAWSSGQTTLSATGLIAGNYTLTVTDSKGCTQTAAATITQPLTALTSSVTTIDPLCGNNDGSASAIPSGGTGSYTYLWSNGNTTSVVSGLTGLPTDTLIITVTDANGCTYTDTAMVNCFIAVTESNAETGFSIYPNPSPGEFDMSMNVSVSTNYMIELHNIFGQIIYREELKNFSGKYTKRFDVKEYGGGIYLINVRSDDRQLIRKVVVY